MASWRPRPDLEPSAFLVIPSDFLFLTKEVSMILRFSLSCFACAFVVVAVGCNAKKPPASVTGTVMYNGKSQSAGSVNFLSTSGSGGQAVLDRSGGYKMDGLDPGEYRVYLLAPTPEQVAPGTKATPQPKFAVAPKFLNPTSSGVKVTLKPGPNDIPIDMKD